MSDFTNTVDVLGDEAVVTSIIDRSIKEFSDNTIGQIGEYAFMQCSSLASVNIPMATIMSMGAFEECISLARINMPAMTNIAVRAFSGCSSLTSINAPVTTSIGGNAFYSCVNLLSVSFPAVTNIGTGGFAACSNLTTLSFPAVTHIDGLGTFSSCANLKALYLMNSVVCTLSYSLYAFKNTPIESGTGSIYVPASLLTSYQAATNWAYYSNRMVGV